MSDKIKEGMSKIFATKGGTAKTSKISVSAKNILGCLGVEHDSKRSEDTFKKLGVVSDKSEKISETNEEIKGE